MALVCNQCLPPLPPEPGPEAAKAEIGKLQTDADFQKAYMNKDAPGHKEAVERMERLFKVAYPGKVES